MIGAITSVFAAIALFAYLYGFSILDPHHFTWLLDGDGMLQFLGSNFFNQEPWHWPPGRIEGYSAPWGTSIVFVDIPWLALLLKAFPAFGNFQYLGFWILGCFILQAVSAHLLCSTVTTSKWNTFWMTLLFLIFPAFLFRQFQNTRHYTLIVHFVVIGCMWLAARDIRVQKVSRWIWAALLVFMFGVFFYFTLIVFLFWLLAELLQKNARTNWRDWVLPAVGGGTLTLLLLYLFGYFVVTPGNSMREGGFGSFSMNLFSWVNSDGFSAILPKLPTRSYEQREGAIYLGGGIFLLLALVGFSSAFRARVQADWKRIPFAAFCIGVFVLVLALSPRITLLGLTIPDGVGVALYYILFSLLLKKQFGNRAWIYSIALILVYLVVGRAYRSTGRFAWMLSYGLLFYLASFDFKKWVLPLAVVLQIADIAPLLHGIRQETQEITAKGQQIVAQNAEWDAVLAGVKQIKIVYPIGLDRGPIGYFAMTRKIPIGPMYTARKDKRAEEQFELDTRKLLEAGQLEPGVLYVVGDHEFVRVHPELKFCELQGYFWVASN